MAVASVNGIDLAYELAGSGEQLVFLNGSGATIEASRLVAAPFVEHFEVVMFDQRGLGSTTIPERVATMADYAADVGGLMDHLGWESALVVGLSFGGMVAQEFAVTSPERVTALALLCTSPGGEFSSFPLHELEDLDPEERFLRYRSVLDERFDEDWLNNHPVDAVIVSVLRRRGQVEKSPEQRRGERLQLEARRGHDVGDRLALVTAPTLVASGRFDGIAPPSNGRAIADRVAGATLQLFDGGHMFMFQDPAAYPTVIAFLHEHAV